MRNVQTLRYRHFCFRVYRFAAMFSHFLKNRGAYCLADAVYSLLPLSVCQIGFEVWSVSRPDDLHRYLQKGGAQ